MERHNLVRFVSKDNVENSYTGFRFVSKDNVPSQKIMSKDKYLPLLLYFWYL